MRPRTMRRLTFVLGLLLVPFLWLGAEPALACSCVPSSTEDFVERADVIASGRLVEREGAGQTVVYRFRGSERYEGDLSPGFEVRTSAQGASCGLPGLVVGRRYLVFMTEERGELRANSCGGTRAATPQYVERVEAVTGPGTSLAIPHPEPQTDLGSVVQRLVAALAWWR